MSTAIQMCEILLRVMQRNILTYLELKFHKIMLFTMKVIQKQLKGLLIIVQRVLQGTVDGSRHTGKPHKDNIKEWTGKSLRSLLRRADDRSQCHRRCLSEYPNEAWAVIIIMEKTRFWYSYAVSLSNLRSENVSDVISGMSVTQSRR